MIIKKLTVIACILVGGFLQNIICQSICAEESVLLAQNQRAGNRGRPNPLRDALELAKAGNQMEAASQLFQLSYSPRYRNQHMQIRYLLGLMLYEMGLNQVAAFQFINVIKQGNNRYVQQALEKLSLSADTLGDETLLNYAISRITVSRFPENMREMLYYRIGEFQSRNGQHNEAANSFSRVSRSSPLFAKAKYKEGLASAEAKQTSRALLAFEELVEARSSSGVTDSARVAGLMGQARVHYQKKDWDSAIAVYRQIPRDTSLWHETLFESSWAMLRSGRFRSALSNFHSLHSAFYEDKYIPESLLLRSIVYLYICKYEEMEKVLNLFNSIYRPVYQGVDKSLKTLRRPEQLFDETVQMIKDLKEGTIEQKTYTIPTIVVRHMIREADFQKNYQYITNLLDERARFQAMPAQWRATPLGRYADKVLNTRLLKARSSAGRQIKTFLEDTKIELVDLFEQEGFIRYEMISGKKEGLKKRIAGKDLDQEQVDQGSDRDFYIQNGFEYWPFRGEYWLDELGNYHYLGTQSCG